uniref:Cyanobacterial aminoacyl-tRNA synthetase CAAD domain-containing protein n=1 Tax=Arundo donax TaxID=35708 RepID=A0A0A9BRI8_ARUDO
MASSISTNAAARADLPLPRRRSSPSTLAPSAPVTLRHRSLPKRGLRCAGADWPEPAFVAVAEKLDAARKARAAAGSGGEDEKGRTGAINGVGGGAVEEPVAVPFAPFEQSLVAVDSIGDDALGQPLGSKLGFEETPTYVIYGTGAFFAGWILSAVVSAIDSIPLLPKILEIVGLGYTIWFSTRYLLFKENRDELLVKFEDLKRRIVGSGDE